MSTPVIFSTGSLHPFGLERIFDWASETGYDGMEVMMDDRWDTHQEAYLTSLAGRCGIPVHTLHPPIKRGAWGLPAGETLVRAARLAAKVGAEVVVAHPPPAGRPLSEWKKGPLSRAREEGVAVAVENMPSGQAKRFSVRRSRSCYKPEHLSGLGDVTLDTSHVGASDLDLLKTLSALEGQLRHVHLSDSRLQGTDDHRLPGKGKLPLKPFLKRVGELDYPGVVSLELKPWPLGTPNPEVILKRMQEALDFTREGLEGR